MRRSSPIVVVSLLILMVALGFSTVGNTKRDAKTVFGAMLYVIGGTYLYVDFQNVQCANSRMFNVYSWQIVFDVMFVVYMYELSSMRIMHHNTSKSTEDGIERILIMG